jgi:beta-glucosidase
LSRHGLQTEYFNNLEGAGDPVLSRVDSSLDHYWWDGIPPVEGLTDDRYSVTWNGILVPRKSGIHALGVYGQYVTLIVEGDTVVEIDNIHHPNKVFRNLELTADRPYRIKVIARDRQGDANCTLHWQEPDQPLMWEALSTARWADHVVLVMGLTARLEGEEMRGLDLEGFQAGDRTTLNLPGVQQALIRSVVATGKPVTLVLMTGSAVSIEREQQIVPSILQAWYGGEAAGKAVADVLFGDYNPAGRLPVTFYRSVEDLPPFEEYRMEGRTYRYYTGEVLYPFGYGLSYTDFSYDNLILDRDEIAAGESAMVSVDVTNTGDRDGEEVVQLFVRDPESTVTRPIRELKGFVRVPVKAGQTVAVTMVLEAEELAAYNEATSSYVIEPGRVELLVGPSSDETLMLSTELLIR